MPFTLVGIRQGRASSARQGRDCGEGGSYWAAKGWIRPIVVYRVYNQAFGLKMMIYNIALAYANASLRVRLLRCEVLVVVRLEIVAGLRCLFCHVAILPDNTLV